MFRDAEHLYFLTERNIRMTIYEAGERYRIPLNVLKEYETWGLCCGGGNGKDLRQCSQTDIDRLSLIMTLHDVGFKDAEVEHYMRLTLSGDGRDRERLTMLRKRRDKTLEELHFKQEQLDRLAYLLYELSRPMTDDKR